MGQRDRAEGFRYVLLLTLCSAESLSPSTPGASAHLWPCFAALREEPDRSNAGEHGEKEQCVLFVGEVPLVAELTNACVSVYIHLALLSLKYLPRLCDLCVFNNVLFE